MRASDETCMVDMINNYDKDDEAEVKKAPSASPHGAAERGAPLNLCLIVFTLHIHTYRQAAIDLLGDDQVSPVML
jgi:hypothetical protein